MLDEAASKTPNSGAQFKLPLQDQHYILTQGLVLRWSADIRECGQEERAQKEVFRTSFWSIPKKNETQSDKLGLRLIFLLYNAIL